MRKLKNAEALGLLSGQSSWEHKWAVVDFSHDVAAGAITMTKSGIVLPVLNTSLSTGSPDNYPPALTAASGARVSGTGSGPLAILTGVFAVHYQPSVGVYNPAAGTTFQVFVASIATGGAGAGGVAALTGVAALNTGPSNVDQMAITAPTERQVSVDGSAPLATVAQLFAGDIVYVSYVTTGAVDPSGRILACVLFFD